MFFSHCVHNFFSVAQNYAGDTAIEVKNKTKLQTTGQISFPVSFNMFITSSSCQNVTFR